MRKNQLFHIVIVTILGQIFFSCTTPGPTSEWEDLKNAQDVKCLPIEHSTEILGIREIKAVDKGSVFIESIDRSGKFGYWEAGLGNLSLKSKFKKVKVDGKLAAPIERFGSSSNLYAYVNKDLKVKLFSESDSSILEYDALTEDIKCKTDDDIIEGFKAVGTDDFAWISVMSRCEDKTNLRVSLVDIEKKAVLRSFDQKGGVDSYSEWLVASDRSLLIVTASPEEDRGDFYIYQFGFEGQRQNYLITIKEHIENWSSIYKDGFVYLATTQGDSMVGDASIVVDKYQLKPLGEVSTGEGSSKVKTVKLSSLVTGGSKIPLAHLSAPVWLDKKDSLVVLIFKWLDNESTVGSYTLEETNEKDSYQISLKLQDLGIFPNSSKMEKVYRSSDKDFMIIKTQSNYFGEYSICRLN